MDTTGSIISITVAAVCGAVAIRTIALSYLRVKNAKNITLYKKDGTNIKVHTNYNREDSRKLIEFIK
jgi:hypothetical protein